MAGQINIKVKLDIEKEVSKTVDNLSKRFDKISKSFDNLSKNMGDNFKNIGTGIETLLLRLSDVDSMKGLKQIEQSMTLLQNLLKSNKISVEQYLPLWDKLSQKYEQVAASATKAANSTKNVGNLNTTGIEQAKTGSFSTNHLKWMDVGNLQQILTISRQQLNTDGLSLDTRRKIANQLENTKKILKDLNLSDRQRAVLNEKELRTQEKIAIATEKKAVASRRSDSQMQTNYALSLEANTLGQIKTKTEELNRAKLLLNASDKKQAGQLKDVNAELEKLSIKQKVLENSGKTLAEANNKTSRSFSQLAQMAASYFSVYAVKNFAMQMANVTGEFELQRKALGALIQDRQAADVIFEKVKQTAVQSPFSVMQLTTAVKQLAAYRIEADKLYDTTYRLADISAGLGVDMERLILAFGQIRAATVLRGQEVRQLTESGIPIISLLADKFGELEKRTVSTGEVFDKISNRLVPFEMINEIFKDMTSNGGLFYNMQKIQADTIKGRLVNLTDAYQLFLDKMGQGNSGIIKGFIGGLESILRNMDAILPVIKGLVVTFGLYKGALLAINLLGKEGLIAQRLKIIQDVKETLTKEGLTLATTKAALAQKGLNSSLAAMLISNPYVALAAVVVGLGVAIWQAQKAQKAFNKEIEKIKTDGVAEYEKLYRTYVKLVEIIRSSTSSVQEQTKAHQELKQTFKDIIPDRELELKYLQAEKFAYDGVRESIYANIRAKVLESQTTKIIETYTQKITDLTQKMEELNKQTDAANINSFLFELQKNVENTFAKNPTQTINEWKKALDALTNTSEYDTNFDPNYLINKNLFQLNDLFKKYGIRYTNNNKELIKRIIDNYITLNTQIENVTKQGLGGNTALENYGKDLAARYEKIINHLDEIRVTYEKKFKTSSDKFSYEQQQTFIDHERRWLEQQISVLEKEGTPAKIKMAEDLKKELQKILGTEDQQAIQQKLEDFALKFKVSFDNIRKYLKSDQQGFAEWSDSINEILEQRLANLEQYENAIKNGADKNDPNIKGLLNNEDLKSYQNETNMLKALLKYYHALKEEKSSGGNAKNPLLEALKEEIALIEKLTTEYEKLVKEGAKIPDAKNSVTTKFKENIDAINKILTEKGVKPIDFDKLINSDDPKAVLKLLEEQISQIKNNPDASKLLGDAIGEAKIKIEIAELDKTENEIKTFLEDIKRKYELSLEINNADSGTRDLLMKMFGISESDIIKDIGSLMDLVNSEIGKRLKEQGVTTETTDFSKLTTEQFNALLEPFKSKEGYGDIAKGIIDLFQYLQDKQKTYIDTTIKAYNSLVKEYATYQERIIDVEDKKIKEIQTLDDQYYLSKQEKDENYYKLKTAIEKRSAEEISQIMFENIKDTELWSLTFENLEKVGDRALQFLFDSLKKYAQGAGKNLPINQFKDLMKQIEKLDEQIKKRNPFKALINSFSGYQAAILEVEKATNTVNIAQEIYNANVDNFGEESKLTKNSLEALKKAFENLATAESDAQKNGYFIKQTIQQISSDTRKYVTSAQDLYTSLLDLGKAFGFVSNNTEEFDKNMNSLVENQLKTLDGVAEIIGGFYSDNVGMIINGFAAAAAGTYKSIVNAIDLWGKDASINEGIDDTTKAIDRLNNSLDRLQTEVDKQMGNDWLQGMNQIAEGYEQMQADIEANIAAEKSKKNPDEDVLYDYEQQLLDAQEREEEIINQMVEEMTGADLKSAAEDFANIWIDAFMAGEDAMGAIEQRFGDMIKNMIVKAVASKVVGSILEGLFEKIKTMVKDGLSQDEIDIINQDGQDAMNLINTSLSALGPWFQDILGAYSDFNGETLQKGIQGVTEQTAGIIEGYLNTIRYEIFKHTNILTSIQNQMQLGNNISSDILYQATQSYQVLLAIRTWQESITTTDNGLPAIRVV